MENSCVLTISGPKLLMDVNFTYLNNFGSEIIDIRDFFTYSTISDPKLLTYVIFSRINNFGSEIVDINFGSEIVDVHEFFFHVLTISGPKLLTCVNFLLRQQFWVRNSSCT